MLAGKPLLCHTIEHARAANSIDSVVVSTDDDEIAELAETAGADVVRRPRMLAGDSTPTTPVLLHVLAAQAHPVPEIVVTLQPTSPMRVPADIDRAVDLLTGDCDSVIGVCEAEHTPYKMFLRKADVLVPLLPGGIGRPRQELPKVYRENGAIYVTWSHVLTTQESIWGQRSIPYIMGQDASIDIDTPLDITLAEILLAQRDRS
jgi:CMP-N-acetylneuraminic acid synthetase